MLILGIDTSCDETSAGIVEDGLRVTEAGLQIKAEIEKIREQAQNLE